MKRMKYPGDAFEPPYYWVKHIYPGSVVGPDVWYSGPFFTLEQAEEYATNPPRRYDVTIVETLDRYPIKPTS